MKLGKLEKAMLEKLAKNRGSMWVLADSKSIPKLRKLCKKDCVVKVYENENGAMFVITEIGISNLDFQF